MGSSVTGNEVLDSIYCAIPYFTHLFDDEVSIALCDTEKFLVVRNGSQLQLHATPGDAVSAGGAIRDALNTGRVTVKDVPETVYGVPFKSYAVPITEKNGTVIGALTLGKSLEKKQNLIELIESITGGARQITQSTNSVNQGIEQLKSMNDEISVKVAEANESTKNTDSILDFVKDIATQSNLLGLNAAIEAARAGEAGRGFSVVAGEIRKMSASTSDSVGQIDGVLKNINQSITAINSRISESNNIFVKETEEFKMILDSIQELNTTSKKLESLLENL